MENNISKKIIIQAAIAFWIFIYIIVVIIRFKEVSFDVVGPRDNFFSLFLLPFFFAIFYYHPLYLLPLILVGYSVKQNRSSMKILFFLVAIILSAIFFYVIFGLITLSHSGSEMTFEHVVIVSVIQFISYFILFYILQIGSREKIVNKLLQVSVLVFIGLFLYISVSAKIASDGIRLTKNITREAITMNDASLCQKIFDGGKDRRIYRKNAGGISQTAYVKCIQEIAVNTNNIQLCDNLKDKATGGYTYCLGEFARIVSDPNLCVLKITSQPETYIGEWKQKLSWCFEAIFMHEYHSPDRNICEKVESEKWKGECYVAVNPSMSPPGWLVKIDELIK